MNSMNSFSNGDAAYHREQNEIQRLQVALSATVEQRDALLAALEGAVNYIDNLDGVSKGYRATITAVRGAA